MKRLVVVFFVAFLVGGFGLGIGSVNAIIILSGDTNITDPLIISPVDTGNQRFFTNILQGGNKIAVLDTDLYNDVYPDTFYNSLSGVTSTLISTVTPGNLAGVNLFVAGVPDAAFTGSEIAALITFLSGGGSILFMGENDRFFSKNNQYINDALIALGSNMRIVPDSFDPGFHTVTGSHIVVDPLTAGVTTFTYAYSSQVSGGTPIFFGTENQPFLEYEGFSVPEPAIILLFSFGLITIAGGRKKFRKQARDKVTFRQRGIGS